MKTLSYPTRLESRYDHAFLRPLGGLSFEILELIRADLFEYLELLTTALYECSASEALFAAKCAEIQRTADRLKEVMRYRSKAAHARLKTRTIDHELLGRGRRHRRGQLSTH
jgi:hypothetical protein